MHLLLSGGVEALNDSFIPVKRFLKLDVYQIKQISYLKIVRTAWFLENSDQREIKISP